MNTRKKGLLNGYHILYIPIHFILMLFIGGFNKEAWNDCNGTDINLIFTISAILDVVICFFIYKKARQKYQNSERISIWTLIALLAYNSELFFEIALNVPLQFVNLILSDPKYYFSHVPSMFNHVHHCMWAIITFFTVASLLIALASQFRSLFSMTKKWLVK